MKAFSFTFNFFTLNFTFNGFHHLTGLALFTLLSQVTNLKKTQGQCVHEDELSYMWYIKIKVCRETSWIWHEYEDLPCLIANFAFCYVLIWFLSRALISTQIWITSSETHILIQRRNTSVWKNFALMSVFLLFTRSVLGEKWVINVALSSAFQELSPYKQSHSSQLSTKWVNESENFHTIWKIRWLFQLCWRLHAVNTSWLWTYKAPILPSLPSPPSVINTFS